MPNFIHNVVHRALIEIRIHNISGDRRCCTGSYKSNYHTITTTTAPNLNKIYSLEYTILALRIIKQKKIFKLYCNISFQMVFERKCHTGKLSNLIDRNISHAILDLTKWTWTVSIPFHSVFVTIQQSERNFFL
jgi:hypothetical protein